MRDANNIADAPGAGLREVMRTCWPIILGSLSYTVMEFADKWMVARLGTEELAAAGNASVWSYTLSTLILGIVGCVSTFVAQRIGRGDARRSGAYAWQGVYIAMGAGALALLLWPVTGPLFQSMGHSPRVTELETQYLQIRLFGYIGMGWMTALAVFFQAVERSVVPMYVAVVGNALNLGLNYVLIFGYEPLGIPMLGVPGAAWATVVSQYAQALLLHAVFLRRRYAEPYGTRREWAFDPARCRELLRVGLPAGFGLLMDIMNWAVFIGYIVGRFGDVQLAANNVAMSFMHLSFMPAVALNQGIAPIVGRWIGRGDIARAKARTYTALKLAAIYMLVMGLFFAVFGDRLIAAIFSDDPEVISLGHRMLILAAIFQGFDAICIVTAGALRGAGDTRWLMWMIFISAYFFFLPIAVYAAFPWGLGGEAFGAWISAAIYIIIVSGLVFRRFHQERWRDIRIFRDDA